MLNIHLNVVPRLRTRVNVHSLPHASFRQWCLRENKDQFTYMCKAILGRDSVPGVATHYGTGVRVSKAGGGEIFCNHPDRSWGPCNLLYDAYRVLPGLK